LRSYFFSCSSQHSEFTDHNFQVFDEAGVTVAVTNGIPKYDMELFEYVEVLTLQEDPDDEESLLYRPSLFTMNSDGQYCVVNAGDRRILVFNSEGHYVRSMGGRGDGPGEFNTINDLTIHDDVITVTDRNSRRITQFNLAGVLLDMTTIPAEIGSRRPDFFILDNGTIALKTVEIERGAGKNSYSERIVVFNSVFDTLWTYTSPSHPRMITTTMASGTLLAFGVPFAKRPQVKYVYNEGILVSNGDDPILVFYDDSGNIQRKIDLGLEPDPFPKQLEETIKAEIREGITEEDPQYKELHEARLKAIEFPSTMPIWTTLNVGDCGFIWLHVPEHQDDIDSRGGYLFRVVSPEGEYMGNTRIPFSRNFEVVQGKLLVNWTPSEAETPSLSVYQIIPAVEGLKYP